MDILFHSAETVFGPHIENYALDHKWEPWGKEVRLLRTMLYLIWYKQGITGLYYADRLFGLAVMATHILLSDPAPSGLIKQTAEWLSKRYTEWSWFSKRPVRGYREQLDSMEHMFREHMDQLMTIYRLNETKLPSL